MRFTKALLTPLSILTLAGVILYDRESRRAALVEGPRDGGEALGRAYAPVLVTTYANAWVVAAETLEQGKSIADAQRALQESWKEGRVKAFTAQVQPRFSTVLPDGVEPSDRVKRAQVAELWRSFARGLNEGR